MQLRFLGGADTVTGSQHMVEANGQRLLRDCGLYQGRRKIANRINREFLFDPTALDAMVLSHAHIDHCGNIPSAVKEGYAGPIHATTATAKLCEVMLMDAARIQEQDAEYLNKKSSRKGYPQVEPLYQTEDAFAALQLFKGHRYHTDQEIIPGVACHSLEAGHILGSELSVLDVEEKGRRVRVGFAVDLGRHDLPIIRDPEPMGHVDVLLLESTYGNRYHGDIHEADDELARIIRLAEEKGGKVLIPSFALERTQEILFHIASLYREQRAPRLPVYVDSPMATALTRIFARFGQYMDDEFQELRETGRIFEADWVHFVGSVKESKELTASQKPAIVISASGMCEHGRILHHLKAGISDPRTTVVIVGYQAEHTLGRRLVEQQEEVRIFGETYKRKAQVNVINAFSAHADRNDLLAYVREVRPDKTFLVHGEEVPRQALAATIREEGLSEVYLPKRGDAVDL
jgi:metallo-beta-lactamase family protein